MNIVIGGASGAMPPVLGWAAVNNQLSPEAWILFLIIFCWTPPHFWALALYRREEYAKVGIPMLPVTHGEKFTLLHIVLYTIILAIVTLMPFSIGMAGLIYLFFATISNQKFITGLPALNIINNKKTILNNAKIISLNKSASKLLNTGINIKINITAIS